MPRNNRKLAFPRAFSIMASTRMGKVIDLLRVVASTRTHRVSAGEVTRRLMAKGVLVEICEYAQGYAQGRPVDLVTPMLSQTQELTHAHAPDMLTIGTSEEENAWSVLARMWPELSKKIEKIDVRTPTGRLAHSTLQAGAPRTAEGRAKTVTQLRQEALADVQAGVKAPRILPKPTSVAEAQQRAQEEIEADRLAMARGVPVDELLARTRGGRMVGMPTADETAGAAGWASPEGKAPQDRAKISPEFSERDEAPVEQAPPKQESYGQMMRRLRGGS